MYLKNGWAEVVIKLLDNTSPSISSNKIGCSVAILREDSCPVIRDVFSRISHMASFNVSFCSHCFTLDEGCMDPSQRSEFDERYEDPSEDPLFDIDEDDPNRANVFVRKELLKMGHVPGSARIVGRDTEIKSVAAELRPIVQGYPPNNVMIYGKTGRENRWLLAT